MTADERDLTPEEEAEVARLVADAGGPVATPPEVVSRLDDVLTGLVAERDAEPATPAGTADVPVSLEAERRRRRWPKALLAAAAVVAGGYGVGAALTGTTMSGDGESAVSADESAAGGSTTSGSDAGGDGQAMESGPERDAADSRRTVEAPANVSALRDQLPRLRSDHLAGDVVRVLDMSGKEPAGDEEPRAVPVPRRALVGGVAACLPSQLGPGDTWFLVRYDGRRAALVASRPDGGAVQASVLGCDGGRLDSVTVLVD
jgi:hypothetical protein